MNTMSNAHHLPPMMDIKMRYWYSISANSSICPSSLTSYLKTNSFASLVRQIRIVCRKVSKVR